VINSLPHDKEVIVVDGHSRDNTPTILAKYQGQIRVVYDEGKGLGNARNVAVKASHGDIIVFVDSDVICERRHFLKFQEYFDAHPEVIALDTAGIHPKAGSEVQRMESLFFASVEKYYPHQLTLRGWSLAFRRTVFNEVGGFWARGSEDNEFSYKIYSRGYKIATVSTESWHMQRATFSGMLKEMRAWGKDAAYFYHKWGNTPTMVNDVKDRRLFKLVPNVRVLVFLAYLASPIVGIRYYLRTGKTLFYLHFVVRHYAYLAGYVIGNLSIFSKGMLRGLPEDSA
jgi:glycosyltransferase involved in cell wall biosynthesis